MAVLEVRLDNEAVRLIVVDDCSRRPPVLGDVLECVVVCGEAVARAYVRLVAGGGVADVDAAEDLEDEGELFGRGTLAGAAVQLGILAPEVQGFVGERRGVGRGGGGGGGGGHFGCLCGGLGGWGGRRLVEMLFSLVASWAALLLIRTMAKTDCWRARLMNDASRGLAYTRVAAPTTSAECDRRILQCESRIRNSQSSVLLHSAMGTPTTHFTSSPIARPKPNILSFTDRSASRIGTAM